MASPHVAGLKLYFDSLCGTSKRRSPVEACEYIKQTGFDFDWASVYSDPIGALGVPLGVSLPTCILADVVSLIPLPIPYAKGTAKQAFNGGACACENW